ncbi:MAG: potassium transporter TrkG, partial [Mucinivorans sp.]
NLWAFNVFPDFWSSLRYGSFQVVSYTSTTGFASSDAAYWPAFSILIMIYMSIQCSMAGSTSGGVKVDRVVLLLKSLRARILKLQHPNAVIRVRLGGITQEDSTVNTAVLLIAFYILVLFISTVVLTLFNLDLSTSFTATVASLGNVGPGFGEVGNLSNMGFLPNGVKWWLTVVMLFGRLELFGLIHIFMIGSWK